MMIKKKSFRWQRAKALYVIPIVAAALACTSKTQVDNPADAAGIDGVTVRAFTEETPDGALFIVDGKEVTAADAKALDGAEIESVAVLKDSSAIKIYGEKGKNGVVMVTTRKGDDVKEITLSASNGEALAAPEVMPEFPGGMSALMTYLNENVKYPTEAQEAGAQGSVIVSFVVKKDGSIADVNVVRSVNDVLDAEAVRVVKGMPAWTPGRQDGKPVDTKYTIPISFKLSV